MSISNRGKSTIWDRKTTKKKKRVYLNSATDIRRMVDKAYREFWSKRKVGPYGV